LSVSRLSSAGIGLWFDV